MTPQDDFSRPESQGASASASASGDAARSPAEIKPESTVQNQAFSYRATLTDPTGTTVTGDIHAADLSTARKLLEAMRLRVELLTPATRSTKPLTRTDFFNFNQQLAALVKAGLPLGEGLRLLGSDMRRGRLANAVRRVVAAMDEGKSLPEAMAENQDAFPRDYTQLVKAGLGTNNLSQVLLNFGLHVQQMGKLRQALRQAVAYPLAVYGALLMVWCFLGWWIVPQLATFGIAISQQRQYDWNTNQYLPRSHWAVPLYRFLHIAPFIALGITALILMAVMVIRAFNRKRGRIVLRDWAARRLPIFGPALRLTLVTQWCDALRVGVESSLDLPAALQLAADVVGSADLATDSATIIEQLASGQDLRHARYRLLPGSLPGVLELGLKQNNLPQTLAAVSEAYRRQAENRTAIIPAIMTPLLLTIMALTIGLTIYFMLLPLFMELRNVGGG